MNSVNCLQRWWERFVISDEPKMGKIRGAQVRAFVRQYWYTDLRDKDKIEG